MGPFSIKDRLREETIVEVAEFQGQFWSIVVLYNFTIVLDWSRLSFQR